MNQFKENITSIYGADGQQWLNELPTIISEVAKQYHLTELVPVRNMSFNYIASGYLDARPIILKLGLNCKALTKESHCLRAFANHAAAEVLANNKNMIIMERSVPGTTLKEYFPVKDIEATTIFCSVLNELHSANVPDKHDL